MNEQSTKGELEAIQQTVRFFESLLQASTDGIVITDAAQNIIVVNEAFCALFGHPWRDVVETSLRVWLGQLDAGARRQWAELEQRVYAEGSCHDVEFRMETAEGVRHFSVNASLLERVAEEEAGVIFSTWRDVTERVRTETALRESEARFRGLAQTATDAIITIGADERIRLFNRAAERIFGYSAEEMVGQEVVVLIPEEYGERHKAAIRRYLETGQSTIIGTTVELKGLRKGGEVFPLELSLSEVRVGGEITFTGIIRDITERVRTEEELRRRSEDLTLLNEVGQLFASTLEEEAIFRQLTRRCVEVFDVDSCLLRLIEDEELVVVGSYFRDPQNGRRVLGLLEETPLRAGEGIAGRVAETGEAAASGEAPLEELTLPPFAEYLRDRHWLVVPMRARDRIIGVLTLMAREAERGPFEERDRSLAQGVANQAAVAIENARLYAETRDARDAVLNMLEDVSEARAREQERIEELELLTQELAAASEESDRLATQLTAVNRLDHIISSSLDLDEIYQAFAEESREIIPFDRLSVALVEDDQVRALALGAEARSQVRSQPRSEAEWREDSTSLRSVPACASTADRPDYELGAEWVFPLAGSAKEAVMDSGRPLIRRDLTAEEQYAQDRQLIEAGLRSGVIVPLAAKGRMLGTLNVGSCQVEAYSEKDLPILQALADQLAIAIDNARLFEETQRRARQLSLVGDIARRAVALLDPDALLWETARAIQSSFDYPDVLIYLVDHEGQQLIRKAWAGPYERDRTPDLRKPIEERGILDWVATHGETVLVNDVSQDPRYVSLFDQTAAELCVPLKDGEIVLGGINVESEQTHAFDQSDVLALETLADNLVSALRNARLYQETRQRLTELSALFEVSGALRGAERVEAMLPIILEETIGVLDADSGAIFLVDEVTGEFVAGATHGRLETLRGLRLGPEEGVCGYVARTCAPYPFADLAQDPHTGERVQPLVAGVQGGVCVPLLVGETLVGTFIVGSEEPRTFGDDEVRLLTAIADMAASAVHRTSLFEELEHRVHELEALFEMGQAVTASLRVEEVLDLVVEVAPRTLRAEGCNLFLWDEREERLVLRAVEGFSQEHVGRLKYRLGEGLAGWVFLEGRGANVPNIAADPRWKRDPEHEATLPSGQVDSALVVPLIVRDETVGVMGVVNKTVAGQPSAVGFTDADESLLTALAGQVAVAIENARLYEDVRELSLGAIRSLATAIDARDPYTRGHSEEVTDLAVRLAREMGWGGTDLEMLEFAALMHDVGKIAVPDAILCKTEPLTLDDWDVIKLHPYHSAQIVKPVKALQRIVPWVYHHQERWDGTGYPDGLKGEDIPLASRIIAVADAYDAMTTDRPYRRALTHAEAVAELQDCAGTQFAPQVVEAFLKILNAKR